MQMSKLQRYCLFITYDGTNYAGWQVQPNGDSIQEIIEKALSTFLREKTKVIGSGRTDSGVHALEQRAHFDSCIKFSIDKLLFSLNGLLPIDIRVTDIQKVESEFHSRFSCKRKIYQYHLHTNKIVDPFQKLYRLHYTQNLDIDKIQKAITLLVGTHDFSSFANEAHRGAANKNPVRTLYQIKMIQKNHGWIFEFEGDGFLYKMVRNLMGLLLSVGSGKIKTEEVKAILDAKDRKKAPSTAPAHGLFLIKGVY